MRSAADPVTQEFRARALATADNPKLARQVILDGIYAQRTLVVAMAYHQAMLEKPLHEARVANFAHAAAVVNEFEADEVTANAYVQIPEYKNISYLRWDVYKWGQQAAKSLVEPPEQYEIQNDVQEVDKLNFKPSKIADAWLAWASFCGDDKETSFCFQKAQKLDPNFGEAYYQPVSLGFTPDGKGGFVKSSKYDERIRDASKYRAYSLHQLDKAEQLEPRLHPLVVYQRYLLAYDCKDAVAATSYLKEYVQAWPSAFAGRERALAQAKEAIRLLPQKN